ncbi:inhibitor of nuclear factor kappa-B kinase subunit epsilon-like isoform X3 [Polyodon spathula]|uniref:inhibitor of nuclear factor kappa-B kinase subunit epsilon-like isoform X3 n=1 Tax=Polyodon spathula TaxID=7913 RepID=UPI001B7E2491|nr:inhibitor of nuclear factor kappa-B kinase subunit epsilon-like isoform X3 [Polyodon spathula]
MEFEKIMLSTVNYLWSLDDVLGQGATASVYKARNKKSGELVAVKVFNNVSYQRPLEVQMREFEMLRKLNHVNIVKLFAVEEVTHINNKQKVLVMEFCPGGSLLNQLEDPEHAFGLPESEFLIVLQCVVAGMNHLRENGVVHRDIKPGNIMRRVGEDRCSIYKLTDFGAARELEDDEKFLSLYGTEEYLHPDMYERAVLRKPQQKSYGVAVDLWSIGVTFYHTAAGSLPFIPYGGPRKNKQIMYKITTEKPRGAIAGVQRLEDGQIEWSYDLPVACQLSAGLKSQLVPVLANILEANQETCWGFDQFFAGTMDIIHRVVIHVFSLQQATLHQIYIHAYNTVSILMEEIFKVARIHPKCQQYLFDGHYYPLEASMKVGSLPPTCQDKPLFVASLEPEKPEKPIGVQFREPEIPVFPPRFDVLADYSLSKCIVSAVHQYLRISHSLLKWQALVLQGFYWLMENIKLDVLQKINMLNLMLSFCKSTEARVYRLCEFSVDTGVPELKDYPEQRKKLQLLQETLLGYINSIRDIQNKLDRMKAEWSKHSQIIAEDKTTQRIDYLLEMISAIYHQYRKDKMTVNLSYNDEQIHKFEKINLTTHVKKVKSLFRDECVQKYQAVLSVIGCWTSALFEMKTQLREFNSVFKSLFGELEGCQDHQSMTLKNALLRIQQEAPWPDPSAAYLEDSHAQMALRIRLLRDEMQAVAQELQHNNCIIESFSALTTSPGV